MPSRQNGDDLSPASGGSAAPAAANSSAAPMRFWSGDASAGNSVRRLRDGVPRCAAHAASIAPLPISAEHPSEVVNVPPTTLPSAAPPPPAAPTESAPAASSVSVVPAPGRCSCPACAGRSEMERWHLYGLGHVQAWRHSGSGGHRGRPHLLPRPSLNA